MGISGLFPYLSLLNLLARSKGSRREREDAHLLCYTLERQLLLALFFMATAQRLVGFLVLFYCDCFDTGKYCCGTVVSVCWGRGVPRQHSLVIRPQKGREALK